MGKSINFSIKLLIDGKEQLATVTENVTRMRRAMEQASGSAQQFRNSLISVNQTIATLQSASGAINSLRDTMAGLTATYSAVQQANTQLTTVMRQRMDASEQDIKSITDVISAQSKLGVVSGTVQKTGAQQVATFLKEKESLAVLIPAMNDLIAQQKGINSTQEDARGVANLMGKAMTGQTSALRRVGITFDEAQESVMKYGTESQRAAMLAEIITNNVGHMNAELGKTDAGKLKQAEAGFAAIKVQIGEVVSAWLPQVTMIAQTLTIANSVITLGKSFQGVAIIIKSFNVVTTAMGVVSSRVSAITRVFSAALNGTAYSATAAKIAIKGLMICTGVGLAVAVLTSAIEALCNSTDEATEKSDVLADAEAAYRSTAAETQASLDSETKKLRELIEAKKDTTSAVNDLNEKYGDVFGNHKTAAEWYDTLTRKSKIYAQQLGYEAQMKLLSTQLAEKRIQLQENNDKRKQLWKEGKAQTVSTKTTHDFKTFQSRTTVERRDSEELTSLKQNGREILQDIYKLNNQLNIATDKMKTAAAQIAATSDTQALPKATTTKTTPRATTPKATGTHTDKKDVTAEGSLDWYEQELQRIRKEITSTADKGVAKAKESEYQALETKYKEAKIEIGLETPEPQAVKTYMEQLQDQLREAQEKFENASPIDIKAKVEALAKVSEIQGEIDRATKGQVSIAAEVSTSYTVKGSKEDKRQSYSNAQQKVNTVQQDFDMGIIDADAAKKQIDAINKELQALDLKPIKVEVEANEAEEAISSLSSVSISSFSSVRDNLKSLQSLSGSTATGLASAGDSALILGQSLQQLGEDSAAGKAGMVMAAIGQIALSFAQALSSCTTWIEWLAFGIAGTAQMISMISTISGFATGGIVGGNSTSGDKVPIRVNSGEMILNKQQQARLFAIADGQAMPKMRLQSYSLPSVNLNTSTLDSMFATGMNKQTIEMKLKGRTAVGLIANETRSSFRSGRRSNIKA